jgi:hypothetical protein
MKEKIVFAGLCFGTLLTAAKLLHEVEKWLTTRQARLRAAAVVRPAPQSPNHRWLQQS